MMFKRILVPLDGSALAESVLPMAARLARSLQGTLILFRVYDFPPTDVPLTVIEAEAEAAQTYLARVALLPELAGLQVELKTLGGATARTILDAVQEYRIDLLVLSSHGRSGFTRLALGSVAEQVARHASIPVLVLRPSSDGFVERWRGLRLPLRVLVALDGSPFAESAVVPAAQLLLALAAPAPAVLQLVRVVQPAERPDERDSTHTTLVDRGQEQAVQEAQDYLQAVTEWVYTQFLDGRSLHVSRVVAVAEDIAATLIELAEGKAQPLMQRAAGEEDSPESSETALVALASHGRSGIQRWELGSVAERVLEGTRVPLLIVRPRRQADVQAEAISSTASGETQGHREA
jgi:nucleotide-binding universal stress UspA family protein